MKKLLASALVIAMMCSMAACGNKPKTDNSSDSGSKSDEPITITMGIDRSTDIVYPEGQSMENNDWMKAYEEAGVKVELTMIASPQQYPQKVALAIAGNNLPDIWKSDKTNFYTAVENGYAYDLTGLKEKYLTDLSKKYVNDYKLPFNATMIDEKEYAWPELNEDPTTAVSLLHIRHDWLDALNLDVPKTQQELVDTMIAFAKEDPDGNGKNDTYGLALKKELWDVTAALEGFFNAYHAYPNIWYEKDGKLIYGSVQADAMKAALADLQKLYQAGAIDKEFIVKDGTKVEEDIVQMKLGSYYGRWWSMSGAAAKAYMADPEKVPDRWWCIDTPSVDDKDVYLQSSSLAPNTFYIVNSKSEHPEALYTLINTWFENMFKPNLTEEEYAKYTVNNEYQPQQFSVITVWPYVNPRLENIQAVIEGTKKPEELTGESAAKYKAIRSFLDGEETQFGYGEHWLYWLENPHASSVYRMKYVESGNVISNLAYGPSTETMTKKMTTLEKLQDETITQIITGQKSVDEFDKFVNDWYKLGGQNIVDEMNEWYATTK